MSTRAFLLAFHERTQKSLRILLKHCATLTEEELNRELEGFGYPTVRLQLHHLISAQRYWVGVLEGRIDVDEDDHLYPKADDLERFRGEISMLAREYLEGASEEELNTARTMLTWGNREKVLNPAHVFTRTCTHIYHHQGQILAMCRLLGKPKSGLDYPIAPM